MEVCARGECERLVCDLNEQRDGGREGPSRGTGARARETEETPSLSSDRQRFFLFFFSLFASFRARSMRSSRAIRTHRQCPQGSYGNERGPESIREQRERVRGRKTRDGMGLAASDSTPNASFDEKRRRANAFSQLRILSLPRCRGRQRCAHGVWRALSSAQQREKEMRGAWKRVGSVSFVSERERD